LIDIARRDSHEKIKMIATEKFILTIKFYTHFLETRKWEFRGRNSSKNDPPPGGAPPLGGARGGVARNYGIQRKGFCQGGPQPPFLAIFGLFGQKMVGVSNGPPVFGPLKTLGRKSLLASSKLRKKFFTESKSYFSTPEIASTAKISARSFLNIFCLLFGIKKTLWSITVHDPSRCLLSQGFIIVALGLIFKIFWRVKKMHSIKNNFYTHV